ncbi:MAG: pyridoxal phosphate-dependent aminotransferase [Candidatus Aminicenantes bacterium]
MRVSDKANQIGESPTFKVTSKAKAMKAEGIDVVDLSVGEPDFATPAGIKAAGIRAIEENFTKYTQASGIPELKKAVTQRFKEDLGLDYETDQVIISSGAKSSLYHLLEAVVNRGDEVIIPAPYWVTYPQAVKLAQGAPVIVPTREEDGFKLTPDKLKSVISPSTRVLILNNPGNPTGAVYHRHELEDLADIVLEEDLLVIADEIYEKLVYDDARFISFASLSPEVKKKTVIINGVSKAYSMTGWRIGYAAGSAEIISGMNRIQSHTTSNACTISQHAALEALTGPQHEISKMIAEFQRRRNYVIMRLKSIQGLSCVESKGAFYLFPNVSSFYEKEFNHSAIRNSYGLAYFLLKEARVALVPGAAFGSEDHIRISYATSMENLEKGLDRIADALPKLKTAPKVKRVALSNTVTRHRDPVPVETSVSIQMRDALIAEMENHLSYQNYFEWNANINGAVIQLRTNVPHLYDFWMENWYPAQLESDLEPHGIIYAVDGISGREPRSFYNSETKTAIMVNADNYTPLRSLALGMVMDISERLFNVEAVRGMIADISGNGMALVGPKGTKKTEFFFSLLKDPQVRLQSNDLVFVRFAGDTALADTPERKLFLPTGTVESYPDLAPLLDSSKCENVVLRKDDCRNQACLEEDDCRLDRGSPFCYKAAKNAYAMLDPYWIQGPAKHVKRSALRWMFILRRDRVSPAVTEVALDEALRILENGEALGGASDIGPLKSHPYYNPHLLVSTPDRMEFQRSFFRRLLETTRCFLVNSAAAKPDDIKKIIMGNTES